MIASRLLLPMLALVASGCATALTPAGQKVRFMKADPPAECKELGQVTGRSVSGGAADPATSLENSKNDARNKAGDLGANYLRWEASDGAGGVVTGTAFQCPDATAAAD